MRLGRVAGIAHPPNAMAGADRVAGVDGNAATLQMGDLDPDAFAGDDDMIAGRILLVGLRRHEVGMPVF